MAACELVSRTYLVFQAGACFKPAAILLFFIVTEAATRTRASLAALLQKDDIRKYWQMGSVREVKAFLCEEIARDFSMLTFAHLLGVQQSSTTLLAPLRRPTEQEIAEVIPEYYQHRLAPAPLSYAQVVEPSYLKQPLRLPYLDTPKPSLELSSSKRPLQPLTLRPTSAYVTNVTPSSIYPPFKVSTTSVTLAGVATSVRTRPGKLLFAAHEPSATICLSFGASDPECVKKSSRPPHIIFLLADDLGWNDVSFHGSRQIPTPNIDALAANGVILQRHYATPVCSPSRAAFMTSRYPPGIGMDYVPLDFASKAALPLHIEVLPQWLKRLGYSTHMVGKWHLGYNSFEHTPTGRGFDTFFGYYNGLQYYYNHTGKQNGHCGLDFWRNVGNTTEIVTDLNGTYSTHAYTDEAKRIIADHDAEKPLFLYLSYQAVHASCKDCNVEAPEEIIERFSYIEAYNRTLYAGAVHVLDRSIGDVLAALQSRGMLADSIVVFASDNGAAPVEGIPAPNAGSNWPLRGAKGNVWEGGVRTSAVFWYGRLSGRSPRPPSQQIMHIVDWAPTFYAAAGGHVSELGDVDGRDLWETLSCGGDTERGDVILEIDGMDTASAIISGRYKLVNRSQSGSGLLLDSRVAPPEGSPPEELDLDALMESSNAWRALQQAHFDAGDNNHSAPRKTWRQELIVKCSRNAISEGHQRVADNFEPRDTVFLFDVFNDPCELNNLASTEPVLRDTLLNKLATYRSHLPSNPVSHEVDERGLPEIHRCTWSTWLDVQPAEYLNCPC
ncbi:arylsulfatase B [Rhipicephalus sanguineus]|uniref:arylsulfatase B n=1 Tax=Rhipicephalus sanguineus TaxID=34632 RepID=UPI0020C3548C|nr:arylsulfatase B [Rhipicephalus sanguineus]